MDEIQLGVAKGTAVNKDLRPIGLPFCAYCERHPKKGVSKYHRSEDCPQTKAKKAEDMGTGNQIALGVIGRNTLAGGKDIIIRAIEAFKKKHEGDKDLLWALEDIVFAAQGRKRT